MTQPYGAYFMDILCPPEHREYYLTYHPDIYSYTDTVFARRIYGDTMQEVKDKIDHLCKWLHRDEVKKYTYMLTFTLKPEIKEDEFDEWRSYVRQCLSNPKHKPISIVYAEELTKAGRPHIHAMCVFSKSNKKANYTYYQKVWGSLDFSKTKGENGENGLNYISKETTPIKLI